MYSRRKGKSGSTRPSRQKSSEWMVRSSKDVEELVVKYSKKGLTPSQVGLLLRDQYGIPDIKLAAGKGVTQIMKENELGLKIPADLADLVLCAKNLALHLNAHKHDMDAKRGLQLAESKLRRLAKYYKRNGVIPAGWKYKEERLEHLS